MIRRKPIDDDDENPERWLVSYADFITLLFAFFVVMYAISSVNQSKYDQLTSAMGSAFMGQANGGKIILKKESTPENKIHQDSSLIKPLPLSHIYAEKQRKEREAMVKTGLDLSSQLSPLIGAGKVTVVQNNRGVRIDINDSLPVSYTHLDVYKRQEQHANQLVKQLATQFDIVLVDASVNDAGKLALPILNESEIIIQLSRKPESIKQAYALIKLICNQLGRRSFGIIVDDANEEQAQVVFRNIAQVAKRYLQIELEFFGAIPTDEKLSLATKLGRTVIDAFPLAKASAAFTSIAKKLDVQLDHAAPFKQAYR